MPLPVVTDNGGRQYHACIFAQTYRQIESRQRFGQRSAGKYATPLQQHKMIGQASDFVERMADVKYRDVQFFVQAFEIRQYFAFAPGVQRSQRLVHQQQSRTHRQRPGDAGAMPLAARQYGWHTLQQMPDTQQFYRPVQRYAAGR